MSDGANDLPGNEGDLTTVEIVQNEHSQKLIALFTDVEQNSDPKARISAVRTLENAADNLAELRNIGGVLTTQYSEHEKDPTVLVELSATVLSICSKGLRMGDQPYDVELFRGMAATVTQKQKAPSGSKDDHSWQANVGP